MDAKERKCAVSRTQDALEVTIAAFESIKDVPADDETNCHNTIGARLTGLRENLRAWHELLARKLS